MSVAVEGEDQAIAGGQTVRHPHPDVAGALDPGPVELTRDEIELVEVRRPNCRGAGDVSVPENACVNRCDEGRRNREAASDSSMPTRMPTRRSPGHSSRAGISGVRSSIRIS